MSNKYYTRELSIAHVNEFHHTRGMPPERRLIFLMHRANRALIAGANAQTIAELGVSSAQLATLYHIAKHPGCSMTEIADLLDLNKSAASGMIQRLERLEFLRRDPSPTDRRSSHLFVTKKGEAVRLQSLPTVRRLTAELTAGFSPAEIEAVFRFLNVIIERYAEEGPSDERR
jgi:DNA-binding MarR family transcriptional regulator